jgi:molybdopterin synthase catalytic subunit
VSRAVVRPEPLSLDEALAQVNHPGAGGICTFLGVVRDHNDGLPITLLEYEAYASMAVSEMGRIMDQIQGEIPGVRLAAQHRTGALRVGDTAVVCVASAPHRDEAFRACRLLIDRIKAQVPVWKREHGPDGPYWVGWRDARCTGEHHEHVHHEHAHHEHAHHEHGPRGPHRG